MTKLQRIQASLVVAAVTGAYVATVAAMRVPENILALSTTTGGVIMCAGSLAALRKRTWGVGLVFAASAAFATAAAMEMGPPIFWTWAVIGAVPMAFGAKPFARFDRSAATLFIGGAAALGVGAALAWSQIWPTVWTLAYGSYH
jgi:hypothetical protein